MPGTDQAPVLPRRPRAMMGTEVVSTTELLEAGEKPAPAGHYDLPAGYKKVKGFGR